MLSRRAIGSFISELGRRRVFRVAVWYAAVALAVIEIVGNVFPVYGISSQIEKLVLVGLVIAAPVTFVLAWLFDITPEGVQRTGPRENADLELTARRAPVPERTGSSIVVLPFSDMSAGDEAYFADGVTEDIIAALSRVAGIRVICRTSAMLYRGSPKPPSQIAGDLGVGHVLDGSIRRAGNRMRIVAQLVDGQTEEQVWSETYDRDVSDVFEIQADVAKRIAQSLEGELSSTARAQLERSPTQDMRAYDAYLRGRHLWNQRTERAMRQGIASLREALDADPDFASAWAALAAMYVTIGMYGLAAPNEVMPLAREAADRALALEPGLAEALTPRAAVKLHYDWDWQGAAADHRAGIASDQRNPLAHHWYANQLACAAQFDDARAELERARELDPLSPAILSSAGIISYYERDHDRARTELTLVTARYPQFPLAHMFLGLVYVEQRDEAAALGRLKDAVQLSGASPEARAALATGLASFGHQDEARALLSGFASESYVSPVLDAYVLAQLNEADAALGRLAEAVRVRSADLPWISVRPALDPIRDLPRYATITQPVFATRP